MCRHYAYDVKVKNLGYKEKVELGILGEVNGRPLVMQHTELFKANMLLSGVSEIVAFYSKGLELESHINIISLL